MAYDPRLTCALTGVTIGQLRYWRKMSIYVPEISAKPAVYSFRDIVALRAFAAIRGERSLQAIRKALHRMDALGKTDHLSSYTLVLQGKKGIVLLDPDRDEGIELVDKPGNLVTVVKLGDVFRSFPLDDIEVPNLLRPREHISVDPEVRGGHPVMEGTRVPFELVAGLVRDGVAPEEISDFYPSVGADAARDALEFSRDVDRFTTRKRPVRLSLAA